MCVFIKLVSMCGIVFICGYLGILKSKTFESRVQFLQKIEYAFSFFKTKVNFTYSPINEIFEDITNVVFEGKENFFKKYANGIENEEKENFFVWNEAIEVQKEINSEDKEILKSFGKLLGKVDKEGQLQEIELAEDLIKNQIVKAEREREKNSKMYKTLGIVVGIGIVIILV